MGPPADWPALSWLRLEAALPGFLVAWAPEAAELGWSTIDLFGCHPRAPYGRLDVQGLALALSDVAVLAIGEDSATVALTAGNAHSMTWRRRPPEILAAAVPLWEIRP